MQLSLIEGEEYKCFFLVTNTELASEKVVVSYEKRGNAENYIKEAKCDMNVGRLLLKSFWANEAVFQMMMLAHNLFLLFKFDFLSISEYRQQIKTFWLKYVFLAAKIIKTALYVIMKLSEKYPYDDVCENACLMNVQPNSAAPTPACLKWTRFRNAKYLQQIHGKYVINMIQFKRYWLNAS
jgi:hypothetical protein